MRSFPHGVRWHPRLGGRTGEFEPVRAQVRHRCHHVSPFGRLVPGPCVGAIAPGEVYLRVEHAARTHTRLAMRCAVLADLVIDDRLTPPLIETLLCARGGILLWAPCGELFVFVEGDDGQARHSEIAEKAALWLHLHGYVRLPMKPTDDRILATAKGLDAIEGWKRESVASHIL